MLQPALWQSYHIIWTYTYAHGTRMVHNNKGRVWVALLCSACSNKTTQVDWQGIQLMYPVAEVEASSKIVLNERTYNVGCLEARRGPTPRLQTQDRPFRLLSFTNEESQQHCLVTGGGGFYTRHMNDLCNQDIQHASTCPKCQEAGFMWTGSVLFIFHGTRTLKTG